MKKAKTKKKTLSIDEVKFHPKNPKSHWEEGLEKSIGEMGYIEPIVVDENNQLLAGHGRVKVMREMGYEELDAIVVEGLSEEQKEKYLLMSNKIGERGGWDEALLKMIDEDVLAESGFDEDELERVFPEVEEKEEPEIRFTREVLEENNYVLFVFDNVIDWNFIKENLDIETVQALDSKKGYRRTGVGRVLDGNVLIGLLRK